MYSLLIAAVTKAPRWAGFTVLEAASPRSRAVGKVDCF